MVQEKTKGPRVTLRSTRYLTVKEDAVPKCPKAFTTNVMESRSSKRQALFLIGYAK